MTLDELLRKTLRTRADEPLPPAEEAALREELEREMRVSIARRIAIAG